MELWVVGFDVTSTPKDEAGRVYAYTSKIDGTISGITPALPQTPHFQRAYIDSAVRAGNYVTVTTLTDHGFVVGEMAIISGSVPDGIMTSINGAWQIIEVLDSTNYKVMSPGGPGTSSGGVTWVERNYMSLEESSLTVEGRSDLSGFLGPYAWNVRAPFVMSFISDALAEDIDAGSDSSLIHTSTFNIPDTTGFIILDYGKPNQEGPIRLLERYQPAYLRVDPAWIFKHHHPAATAEVTLLRKLGAHVMSDSGDEFAPYVTDAMFAVDTLIGLVNDVKSVDTYVDVVRRNPEIIHNEVKSLTNQSYARLNQEYLANDNIVYQPIRQMANEFPFLLVEIDDGDLGLDITVKFASDNSTTVKELVAAINSHPVISKLIFAAAVSTQAAAVAATKIDQGITFVADFAGIAGNAIVLNFDGSDTLADVVAAWNVANPFDTVSFTGQSGTFIPEITTIELSGGLDMPIKHEDEPVLSNYLMIPNI
jgi:hypothetical protein